MKRKHVGRPAAGPRGEKRTAMRHQVTARVSDRDYRLLKALSAVLQTSQADVVTRGFTALQSTLSSADQKVVRALIRNAVARQQK